MWFKPALWTVGKLRAFPLCITFLHPKMAPSPTNTQVCLSVASRLAPEVGPEPGVPDFFIGWNSYSSCFWFYHTHTQKNCLPLFYSIIVYKAHSIFCVKASINPILHLKDWGPCDLPEVTVVTSGGTRIHMNLLRNHSPATNIPRWAHQCPERNSRERTCIPWVKHHSELAFQWILGVLFDFW